MERKTDNQMEEQKPKAPKKAPSKKKAAKKQYFIKRFYIPGFGFVDYGDEASKEALAAWAKKTKVDVKAYLTDKGPE